MPFKHHAAHRHQFPRARYRVTNWAAYEAAPRTTRGGQPRYPGLAIETARTLRALFHLAFRQTEGLIGSL